MSEQRPDHAKCAGRRLAAKIMYILFFLSLFLFLIFVVSILFWEKKDMPETQRTNGTKLEGGEAPTSRDIGGEGCARFPIIPNYECSV